MYSGDATEDERLARQIQEQEYRLQREREMQADEEFARKLAAEFAAQEQQQLVQRQNSTGQVNSNIQQPHNGRVVQNVQSNNVSTGGHATTLNSGQSVSLYAHLNNGIHIDCIVFRLQLNCNIVLQEIKSMK
jgi:hypothetical protein